MHEGIHEAEAGEFATEQQDAAIKRQAHPGMGRAGWVPGGKDDDRTQGRPPV